MSIQAPSYRPTIAYFEAALNLAQGVIEEIESSVKSIPHVEQYQERYQEKISRKTHKIGRLYNKYLRFTENTVLKKKVDSFQQKIIEISDSLMDKLVSDLYRNVCQFQVCLNKRTDHEILAHKPAIESIISSFYKRTVEFDDEMNSESNKIIIEQTRNLTNINSQLLEIRLSNCEHKDDGSPQPTSDFLKPFENRNSNKAPRHQPSQNYLLRKAAYRNARIREYSVCLNQQTVVGIYKEWFEKKLKKESSRVDALESYSQRMGRTMPEQIAACRASLQMVQEQLHKKLLDSEAI